METIDPPDAALPAAIGGHRLLWSDLPDDVREAIQAGLGARVVNASSCSGGFSPALASVLELSDGRGVFAKAINLTRNSFTVGAIRRETEVLAGLPATVPAPRYVWSYNDGEWIVLVMEAIDGRNPGEPWNHDDLRRFLDATTVLAESLAPAPIAAPRFSDRADEFTRWAPMLADHPERLDEMFGERADELVGLESFWAEAVAGDALLQGDLRADNFLLTADGFAVVDWPWVSVGAGWLDLFYALPSVSLQAGGDPDRIWRDHPLSRGVDPDAVNAVLAGGAGFFIARSLEPPVPLIPTIRQFQRAQGIACFRWLASRLGWPEQR